MIIMNTVPKWLLNCYYNEYARKIVPTHMPKNSRRNYSNYTHPIFYLKVGSEIKVAQEAVIQKRKFQWIQLRNGHVQKILKQLAKT